MLVKIRITTSIPKGLRLGTSQTWSKSREMGWLVGLRV